MPLLPEVIETSGCSWDCGFYIKNQCVTLYQWFQSKHNPINYVVEKKIIYSFRLSFKLSSLVVLKIFTFLPWIFAHAEKRIDKVNKDKIYKDKVNFKIYETNNCNANIVQYLKK